MNNEIKKRMNTIMIGSIAAIEKRFGHLFGQDKKSEELSQEEIELKKIFLKLRNDILDLGNQQIKKLEESEKEKYTSTRYRYEWRIK